MSSKTPTFSRRFKWRAEWLAQLGAEWILTHLPRPLVLQLGSAPGGRLWHIMGNRRRIVIKNLRIALAGEQNIPELAEATNQRGNGMLLLPPHPRNWEILSRFNCLFPAGYEVGAFLKAGGMIGILANQRAEHPGVVNSFMGRMTRSSPMPQRLIHRCRCKAIATSVRTLGPDRWSMAAIKRAMHERPVGGSWFQDRWKNYLSPLFGTRDWLNGTEPSSDRDRHRALGWLAGGPPEWQIPKAWWPPTTSIRDLKRHHLPIDFLKNLSLDFILTGNTDKKPRRASRRESTHLIPLVI